MIFINIELKYTNLANLVDKSGYDKYINCINNFKTLVSQVYML